MTTDPERTGADDPLEALSGPLARWVGAFTYDVAADRWWWSDELYRIFGFEPREVVPTTALVAAHLHPEDRRRGGARTDGAVVSVHRIVDGRGAVRTVAVLAVAHPAGGRPERVDGYVADVSRAVRTLAATEATSRIHDPDDDQAVVDQAVGVITATTGRLPAAALALLRATSVRRHLTQRQLAERIIAAATAAGRSIEPNGDRTDPLAMLLATRRVPHPSPPHPRLPPPPENGANQ